MSELLKVRSLELMNEFAKLQKKVYFNKPRLSQVSLFQFTIKLNKKGNWICQCISDPIELEISLCKTSTTLLKRLSYLREMEKLNYAFDSQNSNEFHIAIPNIIPKKQKRAKIRQLQFLF